jgi:hypothetical protein
VDKIFRSPNRARIIRLPWDRSRAWAAIEIGNHSQAYPVVPPAGAEPSATAALEQPLTAALHRLRGAEENAFLQAAGTGQGPVNRCTN